MKMLFGKRLGGIKDSQLVTMEKLSEDGGIGC